MERGFGQSLTGVRLHDDPAAARIAAGQNALALTVGLAESLL